MKKLVLTACLIGLMGGGMGCQHDKVPSQKAEEGFVLSDSLSDDLTFAGSAVCNEDWHTWGSSPIRGPDERVHLFVARWPREADHAPGWFMESQIARYVGPGPEGPFRFAEVVLTGSGGDAWDSNSVHNPTIHKVDGQYALFFIGNDGGEDKGFPANQKIGLAVADALDGPWKRIGGDGLVLAPPEDSTIWSHDSPVGVNNPAFLKKDGRYFLYYKARRRGKGPAREMGLAIANELDGPYRFQQEPVTPNDQMIEDGYAFKSSDRVYMLTTDNYGTWREGGGLLWPSEKGIRFGEPRPGYYRLGHYLSGGLPERYVTVAGRQRSGTLERPQVLMRGGQPTYVYFASGTNIYGDPVSCSYVMSVEGKAP
jgi:hypothetical protein